MGVRPPLPSVSLIKPEMSTPTFADAKDSKFSTKTKPAIVVNPPVLIEMKECRFLVMDAPSDATLPSYLEIFKEKGVSRLVRACEPSYRTDLLTQNNIGCHDLYFQDGAEPPTDIIDKWLKVCEDVFVPGHKNCIAVHCVAGLGRAPVLIAIALIERTGIKPIDAVAFIRKKRRGAFNSKQLNFLEHYQPRGKPCCIM